MDKKRKYICTVVQENEVKNIVFESLDSKAIETAKSFGAFLAVRPYKEENDYYEGLIFHNPTKIAN